jgi:hypothetical protein
MNRSKEYCLLLLADLRLFLSDPAIHTAAQKERLLKKLKAR